MSEDAKLSMTMHMNLWPAEQSKVEAIDEQVSSIAIEKGITGRLLWNATGEEDNRTIQLLAAGLRNPLISLPESEFADLDPEDLVGQLRKRPR